jgi:uncharacterized coiled-coil protein SlyX
MQSSLAVAAVGGADDAGTDPAEAEGTLPADFMKTRQRLLTWVQALDETVHSHDPTEEIAAAMGLAARHLESEIAALSAAVAQQQQVSAAWEDEARRLKQKMRLKTRQEAANAAIRAHIAAEDAARLRAVRETVDRAQLTRSLN